MIGNVQIFFSSSYTVYIICRLQVYVNPNPCGVLVYYPVARVLCVILVDSYSLFYLLYSRLLNKEEYVDCATRKYLLCGLPNGTLKMWYSQASFLTTVIPFTNVQNFTVDSHVKWLNKCRIMLGR